MGIFEEMYLGFEEPLRATASEVAVTDVIPEKQHPETIKAIEADVSTGLKNNRFGSGDTPGVGRIERMAIFKELQNPGYRKPEFARNDSKLYGQFCKTDSLNPFGFQTRQDISRG